MLSFASNLFLSLLALFLCCFIPGRFFCSILKLNLEKEEEIIFPIAFGLMLFLLAAYLFSFFHFFIGTVIFFLIINIWFFIKKYNIFPKYKLAKSENWKNYALIIIFSLIFSLPMITNGEFGNIIHLTVSNISDALLHIAYVNELIHHFPPDNPGFTGTKLIGYHFFSDFLIAKFTNLFSINPLFLYFRFMPILTALLWGFGIYMLMISWIKNRIIAFWSSFLTFFGGSFAIIPDLFFGSRIDWNSGFGILQPSTSLVNPPFALSIVAVIFGLFSLLKFIKSKNLSWTLPVIIFFGVSTEIKVYAGMIMIAGLCFMALLRFIKKDFRPMILLGGVFLIFYLTYWQITGSAGYLIFYPFWEPASVFVNNFPLFRYENKIMVYSQYFDVFRIIKLQIFIFLAWLLGNLGSRTIPILIIPFAKKRKLYFDNFSFILLFMATASFFIPLLFIESIKVFEIVQMFNYFMFFASIFAAIGIGILWSLKIKKGLKIVLLIAFIIITLPSAYSDYFRYLQSPAQNIQGAYYQSLLFLKQKGNYDSTVMEIPPKNVSLKNVSDSIRWYENYATLDIEALSDKRGFFSEETSFTNNMNISARAVFALQVVKFNLIPGRLDRYSQSIIQGLKKYNISFLYSFYPLSNLQDIKAVKNIYAKGGYFVYQINKSKS